MNAMTALTALMQSFTDFYHYPFLTLALLAVVLLSLSAGLLSPLIVARGLSYFGEGVGHASFFTFTLASTLMHLFFPQAPSYLLWPLTLILTLLAILPLGHFTERSKLPRDAIIGLFLVTCLSLGVILSSFVSLPAIDLEVILFGNILLVTKEGLIFILLPFLASFILVGRYLKHWSYFSLDRIGAELAGLPVRLMHHFFLLLLATWLISAIRLCGSILSNGLLLIPGLFALRWGRDRRSTFRASVYFSLLTSMIGLYLANILNLSPGPTIILVQVLLVFLLPFFRFRGRIKNENGS